MESKLHYRPDIDGLRAIAVLSVLAYHLRINMFRGGFVGVDVFFVISGYLISAIILKDIAAGTFSIVSFYERRVRRIFPALIALFVGTTLLAYFFFLPTELIGFAKSLLAALFSVSNFYFWRHSGYFSAPVDTKPLIHTWSLAVEEQFYIFLPIFLFLAHRFFPRRLRTSIVVIALGSFVLSAVGAYRDPTAAFYLPHTRAWELLLGVLISLDVFPAIRGPVLRNVSTICGLGLISAAVFGFSAYTPFPGIAALLPCVGAALIIAAGRSGNSLVGRMLSLKPMVFIGLISYSLYLWHWPIIVFQGMDSLGVNGALATACENNLHSGVARARHAFMEIRGTAIPSEAEVDIPNRSVPTCGRGRCIGGGHWRHRDYFSRFPVPVFRKGDPGRLLFGLRLGRLFSGRRLLHFLWFQI